MSVLQGARLGLVSVRAVTPRGAPARFMSAEKAEIHPNYFKLKETQKKFQQDNGLLIHERYGTRGKMLYNLNKLVLVAAAIALARCIYNVKNPGS